MAVHANSVIPTWLNSYWPELYVSLTDKEEWSIINEGSGITVQFADLATQINAYKNVDRSSVVYNLISGIYSYHALNQNFGVGTLDLSTYVYKNFLSLGEFGKDTLIRAVNYYNDYTMGTSAKLTSSINYLDNDAIEDEDLYIEEKQSELSGDFQSQVSKFLFEDPPLTETQIGKQGLGIYIFNTLLYKRIYQNLNVGSMVLPPYIT